MLLERYEILRSLSKGGMGEIFLGKDTQTGQFVAIKFMRPPQNDLYRLNRARIQFDREVNIALTIDHEHILKALAHGEAGQDGQFMPFLIYPYIAEGSLLDFMKQYQPWSTWPLPQLADIIMQAASGLYALHHNYRPPIIHLDVKPANFLLKHVQDRGPHRAVHLWLSDFGIARWQRGLDHQTSNIEGTPGYMAPEYLSGYVSPAVDQYALARVTRYLFTGNQSTFLDVQIPLTQLNPERISSHEIDDIVAKALSPAPEQRFPSVLDFAEELLAAVLRQDKPGFYEEQTESVAPSVPQQAESKELPEPVFDPVPILDLHISAERVDRPLPQELVMTEKIVRPTVSTLPHFPLHIIGERELVKQPNLLAWSPDGSALLSTFYGRAPTLLLNNGNREELSALSSAYYACWSPDSRRLAVSTKGRNGTSEVYLWERGTTSARLIFSGLAPSIDGLDWSSSDQLAVWVTNHILLYRLDRLTPATLFMEADATCGSLGTLRWSPDALWLAAGTSNGMVICWHRGRQQPYWQLKLPNTRIYSLAWSADSQWLAVAFQNKRLEVWHVREQRRLLTWVQLPGQPQTVSFSAWDRSLVLALRHKLLFGNGEDAEPSATYPGQMIAVWSPDGKKLATLDAPSGTQLLILQRDH